MEEKFNQATPQRPSGTRPLDAAMIPVDMSKYIKALQAEDAYQKNGKNAITIFKSDRITITLIALKAEQNFQPGQEAGEATMSLQVLSGALSFESMDSLLQLHAGHLLAFNHQLAFNASALEVSICLLTLFK